MNSLMVLGGSGFFGKSILDAYRRGLLEPWDVSLIYVVARHASSLQQTAPDLLGIDIQLMDIDISNCNNLPFANYVIHAAATTDASRYLSQPALERANILSATTNYCQLAKKFHRSSKVVYCSSGAVYGQQDPLVYDLSEDDDVGQIKKMDLVKQDYAAAKRDGERFILDLGSSGCNVSIARCFSFIGPYLPQNQHFAIGNFIRDGLLGRPIKVKSDHAVYRSYMHSDDLVLWLMGIAQSANPQGSVFNVGSNEPILIGDLAIKIADYFRVQAIVPLISNARVDRYIPSTKKVNQQLGLKQVLHLDQAISQTVQAIKSLQMVQP